MALGFGSPIYPPDQSDRQDDWMRDWIAKNFGDAPEFGANPNPLSPDYDPTGRMDLGGMALQRRSLLPASPVDMTTGTEAPTTQPQQREFSSTMATSGLTGLSSGAAAPSASGGETALPPAPSAPFTPPSGNPLSKNPQLPIHPLTEFTDSEYEAREAILRGETSRAYQNVLRQLGYIDPETGQRILGDVELGAGRQRRDLTRGRGLAVEEVTGQAQRGQTLFSGRRGTNQARAEHPFVQSMADLEVDLPRAMTQLYEQGVDLVRMYELQRNLLLVDAARRAALRAKGAGASGGGGGTTPTPPGPNEVLPGLPGMPDTDPTGREGTGVYGAPPDIGGLPANWVETVLASIPEVVPEEEEQPRLPLWMRGL